MNLGYDIVRARLSELEREADQVRLARAVRLAQACCQAATAGLLTRIARAIHPQATNCQETR